ncbi:MAG TPA: FAD-dependent oxidoreductase [Rectinemataceae bacterium]|nr:FAD-dependent oxidoreductase [Rectinemataceae bacterium]
MSLESLRRGLRKRSGRESPSGGRRSRRESRAASRAPRGEGESPRRELEAREWRGSVVLEGRAASYQEKVELGWYAARFGYKGVVNDLEVEGLPRENPAPSPAAGTSEGGELEGASFDAAVVGGGVVGCAIARELAKWKISVILLEKEYDVAVHTSSRNDGMIHDGFAARPGSLKARYNVLGNRLWGPLAAELGIDFARPGSLIVFHSRAAAALYPVMAARAAENGVDGWELWSRGRVRAEEPDITDEQQGAFFLPSAGVLSPYKATVALAESAAANGVRIALETRVAGFDTEDARILRVRTNRGAFRVGVVVNAAGNWADQVAGLANDRFFSLHQRRGVDLVLDERVGAFQRHILAMPSLLQLRSKTKGGGLVVTTEGNVLVGPTAAERPGREDYATSSAEVRELERHLKLNRKLSPSAVITYFAGVRPCTYEEDFVVERSDYVRNLVHAAGMQSPGLASAPAVAADVARYAIESLGETSRVVPRTDFRPGLAAPVVAKRLAWERRAALVESRPDYGRIVCRCEEVSEGEVRDALRSAVPAFSLDAVKRRTRAGAGRCHGGFCTPRVMEIVADEAGIPLDEVTKRGPGSPLVLGRSKAPRGEGGDAAAR